MPPSSPGVFKGPLDNPVAATREGWTRASSCRPSVGAGSESTSAPSSPVRPVSENRGLPARRPVARADGRYPKLLALLAKTRVLVIDDFDLAKLGAGHRRDLIESIEGRDARCSTIVTSRLPVEK